MPAARPPERGSPLARLAALFREHTDAATRRALAAIAFALLFASAHLARVGTEVARGATFGLLGGALAVALVWAAWARRAWRTERGTIVRAIGGTDPELASRILRALRLVERGRRVEEDGSPELAQLHFDRLLARATPERIGARAAALGRRWYRVGLGAGVVALAAVAVGPFRVVEGLDVLLARHGEAPLPFDWLASPVVVAHPPEYLRQRDTVVEDELTRLSLPRGTQLTVRGTPIHAGRRLVLFDGASEVPFVDDAEGGLVARFTLGDSTRLRIAARFGEVRLPQHDALEVTSIPDEEPKVKLEGAPRTAKLLDEPDVAISYEASDDHGLREVDLVLRAGAKEDRRVLARLDGETRENRGGVRLRASDPFFRRTYVPVEVTVEARDNDPITGPKWGKSAAITLVPPAVGEPEALRYEALLRARDAFVDLAADRIEAEVGPDAGQRKAHAVHETEETDRATGTLDEALDGSYGGLRVPRRAASLARGQERKLREALAKELRSTTKTTHEANRKVTEDATLSLDAGLRLLGATDSASVARRLAEVADDCAAGADIAKRPADRERGVARLEAAATVLESGGAQLSRLGALGRDLGEIVANDLKRIRRARGADDYLHAELAARDLAARLRRPSPSFSGGRRGGVESGGGSSSGDPDDGSAADGQIAEQQRDIEELAQDHAAELAGNERALGEASSSEETQKLADEARRHAQAVRDAVRPLRSASGADPGSAEASAATGREHAEAMAGALERGDLAGAVESGRNAQRALDEAAKPGRKPLSPFDDGEEMREDARAAQNRLAPELAWAEQSLEQLRQAASARARQQLQESSGREGKLADRARNVADQGRNGPAAMPGDTLDMLGDAESAMREAQRALASGEGDKALERQRAAQRLLEMARASGSGDGSDEQASDGSNGARGDRDQSDPSFDSKLPIPSADDHRGPEAFRRRVIEGLAGSSDPRLRAAVKRYAEGLLR